MRPREDAVDVCRDEALGDRELMAAAQLLEDALLHDLVGALLPLGLHAAAHLLLELVERVEVEGLEPRLGHLGELDPLDVADGQADLPLLAPEGGVLVLLGDGDLERADVAGLCALERGLQLGARAAHDRVAVGDGDPDVLVLFDRLPVHDQLFVDDEEVVGLAGAVRDGDEVGLRLADAVDRLADVEVGDLDLGPLGLDPGVLLQLEGGLDLDGGLEGEGSVLLELDLLEVDLRLADGVELLVLDDLLVAGVDEVELGLLHDGLAVLLLEELPGDLPAAEAGDVDVLVELLVLLFDLEGDLLLGDLELEGELAGPDLGHLGGEIGQFECERHGRRIHESRRTVKKRKGGRTAAQVSRLNEQRSRAGPS